jgi:hypothetical protein
MINNGNTADYVDKSFRKFMHSVNLECNEQLGLSVYDLYDLDYRAHYEALSIKPTWAEWDRAVRGCVEDIKEENGVDW